MTRGVSWGMLWGVAGPRADPAEERSRRDSGRADPYTRGL